MIKIDYKKELKELYSGKKGVFEIVEVPELKYLQIHGSGNPNTDPSYSSSVEALYAAAYAIKFISKKQEQDFVVMPLQGLWYAEDMAVFTGGKKEEWKWTMMIMMPDFVTEDMFREGIDTAKKKKDNYKIDEIFFQEYEEGFVVQTLHIGSYNEEGPVISAMHSFVLEQGYKLTGKHHEIYLSDPRKTDAASLKTILRQPIIK